MKAAGVVLASVLTLTTNLLGSEPGIGDSVIVIANQATLHSTHKTIGTVATGTRFTVRQKSRGWILGKFQMNGRYVFGWILPSSVGAIEPLVIERPSHEFPLNSQSLARDEAMRNKAGERCRAGECQFEPENNRNRPINETFRPQDGVDAESVKPVVTGSARIQRSQPAVRQTLPVEAKST